MSIFWIQTSQDGLTDSLNQDSLLMSLTIPHISQIQDRTKQSSKNLIEWERKICWITCIKMVYKYFSWKELFLEDLLVRKNDIYIFLSLIDGLEKKYPFYTSNTWWLHYALVKKLALYYWIYWVWDKIDPESWKMIDAFGKYLYENKVLIASVNLNFKKKDELWWHLIVIKGIKKVNWEYYFVINDPISNNWNLEILEKTFRENFSWSYLVLSDKNEEIYMANSPIFIEKRIVKNSNFWFFCIHWDEKMAYDKSKEISWKIWDFAAIHQNWERFLRYESNEPFSKERTFIRIDPNRIFDSIWLKKSILALNKHLTSNIDFKNATWKWNLIRNYILSVIDEYLRNKKTIILSHNNNLMDINILKTASKEIFINPNLPNNAFIITSNSSDFNLLKEKWISTLIEKRINNWSLSSYINAKWWRSFTVETGHDDIENFEYFVNAIIGII